MIVLGGEISGDLEIYALNLVQGRQESPVIWLVMVTNFMLCVLIMVFALRISSHLEKYKSY